MAPFFCSTMSDLKEAGQWIAPVGERAHRNASADGGADTSAAPALAGLFARAHRSTNDRSSRR